MENKPLIDPQNMSIWVVTCFICALLGLVLSMVGIYRIHLTMSVTQAEVLALTNKIADLEKKAAPLAAQPAGQ
jgi:hypothetical protein